MENPMKEQILKMKLELKELARLIREKKKQRKNKEITGGTGQVPGLESARYSYRHKHVAYCLVRGRKIEECDSGKGLDMPTVEWVMRTMSPESKEKLYVVVSDKLHPSQQAVQAGHAVAEFLRKNPHTQWANGHLIYLKDAPSAHFNGDMKSYYGAQYGTSQFAEFVEPDLGYKITAYAVFSYNAEQFFKNLKLV
jgi:hypothetical protein